MHQLHHPPPLLFCSVTSRVTANALFLLNALFRVLLLLFFLRCWLLERFLHQRRDRYLLHPPSLYNKPLQLKTCRSLYHTSFTLPAKHHTFGPSRCLTYEPHHRPLQQTICTILLRGCPSGHARAGHKDTWENWQGRSPVRGLVTRPRGHVYWSGTGPEM